MYRTVQDFLEDWQASAQGTLRVFEAMTDDKLTQAIAEGHNTLGWLAWHLTNTPVMFGEVVDLTIQPVGNRKEVPTSVATIVDSYKAVSANIIAEAEKLTDEDLLVETTKFGGPMLKGKVLRMLVDHQTHHRGQMTVLLRQADLHVPGVMGPTKEQQR